MEGYSDIPRINLFFKGLLYCAEIEEIDLDRLKQKSVEVLELGKLPPIPTQEEVMQFIEEIYNKNSHKPTLYIYTEYRKQVEERMAKGVRIIKERNKMYKYLGETEKIEEE